jgi:membrane-associated HD superfamily phosphohydrolase
LKNEVSKIEKYNQSKIFWFATYACISLVVLFIIGAIAQYYSLKLKLTNPLIPEILIKMAFETYMKKVIVLFSGLLVIFALTFYKKNIFAFALSVIIIGYYIMSNFPVPGWNTQ